MGIVVIFFIFILFIVNAINLRTVINLDSILYLSWLMVLVLTLIQRIEVHHKVIIIMIIFFLGYFVSSFPSKYRLVHSNLIIENQRQVTNIYKLLSIIVFITLLFYLNRFSLLKTTVSPDKLRLIKFEFGLLFQTGGEYYFYRYFIDTVIRYQILISICNIIIYRDIQKWDLLIALNVFLYTLIGEGRMLYFNILLIFIVSYFFFNKKINRKVQIKFKPLFGLIACFFILSIGLSYLTLSRLNISVKSWRDLYKGFLITWNQGVTYLVGPLQAFTKYLEESEYLSIIPMMGTSSLSGLFEPLSLPFRLFGLNLNPNEIIGNITSKTVEIGNVKEFNAFYTVFLNGILDGNIIGVFMLAISLGFFSRKVWNNFVSSHVNVYSLALVVFYSELLISTLYRFNTQLPSTFFVFFILIYKIYSLEITDEKHSYSCYNI